MKRILISLVFLFTLVLPSLARAQYTHTLSSGSITLSCTNTGGSIGSPYSTDVYIGTLSSSTTATLPALASDCTPRDHVEIFATQGTNHSYTLTLNGGAGTVTAVTSNGGTLLALPTSTGGQTDRVLHQIWIYDSVASTPVWELVTQETNPASTMACAALPALTGDATTSSGSCAVTNVGVSGTPFAPSATIDTTNASNISSGTLLPAYGGTGTFYGPGNTQNLITNDTVTGTGLNLLAKYTAGGTVGNVKARAIITTAGDTTGARGIVTSGAGNAGSAVVQFAGLASCVFDNATTANDFVVQSSSVNGDCHDAGTTWPVQQIIGLANQTKASPGTYIVQLFGLENSPAASIFQDSFTNDGSTGTGTHQLVTLSSAGNAILPTTSTTTGILGICIANCGTTGSAIVQQIGQTTCTFSNSTTRGNYAVISSSVAGDCMDAGVSLPAYAGWQLVGKILATSSPGNVAIELLAPENYGLGNSIPLVNNASGTTVNHLVKFVASSATITNTATSDVRGALGICIQGCGTSGSAEIQQSGIATCTFDGAATAADYVGISQTTPGDCTSLGTQPVVGVQIIGRTDGSGRVILYPSEDVQIPPVTTHTLTGATPTAAVASSKYASVDVENQLLAANVTSMTLPGSTAVADGEIIYWSVKQSASGGPWTLAAGTVGPLTAGSGTTIAAADGVSCPKLGTTQSGSAPSELDIMLIYHAAISQWEMRSCNTILGQAPTVSSCGSGAAIGTNSIDEGGNVTIGSTSPQTACTITWSNTYTKAPDCNIMDRGPTYQALAITSISTTAMTFTAQISMTNDTVGWVCKFHG